MSATCPHFPIVHKLEFLLGENMVIWSKCFISFFSGTEFLIKFLHAVNAEAIGCKCFYWNIG